MRNSLDLVLERVTRIVTVRRKDQPASIDVQAAADIKPKARDPEYHDEISKARLVMLS